MLVNWSPVYTVTCVLYNDQLRMMIGNKYHVLPKFQPNWYNINIRTFRFFNTIQLYKKGIKSILSRHIDPCIWNRLVIWLSTMQVIRDTQYVTSSQCYNYNHGVRGSTGPETIIRKVMLVKVIPVPSTVATHQVWHIIWELPIASRR